MRTPRHVRLLLSLAGLAAAIPCLPSLALSARSGQVAPAQSAPARGTGLILGQVVDAASGKPVAGASVDFNGRSLVPVQASGGRAAPAPAPARGGTPVAPVQQQRVLTDGDGRFVFHDLPKGQYSFNVSLPGYLGGGYGQRSPTGQSRAFDLEDGERVGDLKLLVWKFGALSGTVVDESGEPVVGVQVRALRRLIVGGKPRLSSGPSVATDDRGVYRIFNLPPGDYILSIISTQTTVPVSSVTAYQLAMNQGRGGPVSQDLSRELSASGAPFPNGSGYTIGDSMLLQTGNSRSVMSPPPGENGALAVYQPLFYPAASVSSQATPIRLTSGEERSGLDLQLRLVRSLRVSGSVMGPTGPVANLGVHLLPGGGEDVAADSLEAATTSTDVNGAFTFLGVPAGQYTLAILKAPRPVPMALPAAARGGPAGVQPMPLPPPQIPTEPVLWAQMAVTVADADVTGLSVSTRTGIRVSGQLQFDGAAPRPTPDQLQRATISLSSADGRGFGQPIMGRGNSSGGFTTQGYPPGKYFLSAGIPAPGWSFKTALAGGRDLSEVPLELDSNDVSGVTIIFTDRQTQLSGKVQDPKSATNVDATVVVFPAAYQAWFDNGMSGRRWRSTRTSRSGDFSIGSLLPGEYLIVALTDEPGRDAQDSRYFAALAGVATHISLGDGEKKVQDLTIVKTPPLGVPPSPAVPQAPTPVAAGWRYQTNPLNPLNPPNPESLHVPFEEPAPQQPQLPARDNLGRPAVGTAVLTGTVVADDAGNRPIRRALLSLSGGDLRGQRTTVTDDAGHFVFVGLPAGRFSLSASKPAYVGTSYGQRKPNQPPTALQLTEGQTLDVSLRMMRGAAITGTILGPTGQPTQGIQIQLMQYRMVNGERQLSSAGSNGNNNTDDRGVFRLYGLAPGEYILAASRSGGFQADAHVTTTSDIQWAQQALRQAPAASPGASTAASALPPAPAPGPTVGYASVFYPGTLDPATATPITLTAGEERTGIDVPLQLVSTARIQGTVIGLDGQPVQNAQLSLNPKSLPSTVRMPFLPGFQRTQEGKFTANGVPPGDYTITARVTGAGSPAMPALPMMVVNGVPVPPVPPSPPAPQAPGAQGPPSVLWAMADVNVNGTDITDLVLNLQRGMTLTGRLAFEGKTLQPPADITRARVTLSTVQPAVNGLSASVTPAKVEPTGAFTLEGILPGRYRVQASMATATTNGRGGPIGPPEAAPGGRGAAPPAGSAGPVQTAGQNIQNFQNIGWSMKSAIVNGVDALDFPFEVRPNENLTNVLVTFTDQQTEITGTLTDRADKPVPEFSIIVFSADRRFWTPTSRRIRQSRPSADGTFRIPGLPPGEYYMSAVADFEPGQVNDPAFLDPLIAGSFKLTLAEGEKKTQSLKLAGGGD